MVNHIRKIPSNITNNNTYLNRHQQAPSTMSLPNKDRIHHRTNQSASRRRRIFPFVTKNKRSNNTSSSIGFDMILIMDNSAANSLKIQSYPLLFQSGQSIGWSDLITSMPRRQYNAYE